MLHIRGELLVAVDREDVINGQGGGELCSVIFFLHFFFFQTLVLDNSFLFADKLFSFYGFVMWLRAHTQIREQSEE